jgi:hypothetical protein
MNAHASTSVLSRTRTLSQALYDFEPEQKDELKLQAGDVVAVAEVVAGVFPPLLCRTLD